MVFFSYVRWDNVLPKVAMVLLLKQKSISISRLLFTAITDSNLLFSPVKQRSYTQRATECSMLRALLLIKNPLFKPSLIYYPLYSHNVSGICEMKSLPL